ncbi:elongation factor Tu GTP binding domain [Tritrichomonas foetus]|uniref:Elongation factor Tu GTP binding domain n=1 Tax=Tritrichomonas foetus TaxID=1144522 RepID=A0A1J4J2B3_9EUKA|nr:elongation factor Tu GTP binding domain [Tritrichomonas foetus]|eukprot:OHS92889.1 elongation factor Tu GTP binding domain [Tritrichomonas foetus]
MEFTSNKFDQFGNYIGSSDSESEETTEDEQQPSIREPTNILIERQALPEDREFYSQASEVYPSYTKVKHEDEDRQDYTTPIIEPTKSRVIAADLKNPPITTFDKEFMKSLFKHPHTIRNVAFVGALGHGKTELIDSLVSETHPGIIEKTVTRRDVTNQIIGEGRRLDRLRWMDRLFLEKRRELTIFTEVMALVHETTDGEPVAMNLIDTPGHPDFMDQVEVGLSMADGVVFCIDVVEGLTYVGQRLLQRVVNTKLPIALCVTKVDRLILELKHPPDFAYQKMRRVIEEVNTCLRQNQYPYRTSPEEFNVCFTSAHFSLCFTLESIGLMYHRNSKETYNFQRNLRMQIETHKPAAREFGSRLWGDFRLDGKTIVSSSNDELPHPFVKFVLEPIYKVFTHVLSYEPQEWAKLLRVDLTAQEKKLNTAPLLRIALSRIFGPFSSFVQVIYNNLPSPIDRSNSENAKIVAHALKFVPSRTGDKIHALVRIFRGVLKPGMEIYALSKSYAEDDSIDPTIRLGNISIPHVRYTTPINEAFPGMIVKIESTMPELQGISILSDVLEFSLPPAIIPISLMKIAIEPLIPDKHPDMVKSVAKAQLCYPSLNVRVEVNGEHTLMGTGEMFLDCVMHDIRNAFDTIEIKVSDPFAVFNETVGRQSVTICQAEIDENNSIGFICEPLNLQTLDELEIGKLALCNDLPKVLGSLGFDELSRESVLSFGPNNITGPNILSDERLPDEKANDPLPPLVKTTLERSFVWATSEGPLCDEMMRGVNIKIVDAHLDTKKPIMPFKIIPAVRKAIFASFLCASPRLMEPIYYVEIITPPNAVFYVEQILAKRRGKVLKTKSIHGTTLKMITAEVPLIDSFGMEVDMRAKTNGQAFALSYFYRWDHVPGEPLDTTIQLRPLEPSPEFALAREFVVKSRRRRGQSEDVDLSKFVNEDKLIEIASLLGDE